MTSIAYSVPILPGKTEEWKRFCRELLESRRNEYEASRRRIGIKRECAYLQQTPLGDMAVIYIEADGIARVNQSLATSDDPFDKWFRGRVLDIHGIDLTQPLPGQRPEIVFEWDAD